MITTRCTLTLRLRVSVTVRDVHVVMESDSFDLQPKTFYLDKLDGQVDLRHEVMALSTTTSLDVTYTVTYTANSVFVCRLTHRLPLAMIARMVPAPRNAQCKVTIETIDKTEPLPLSVLFQDMRCSDKNASSIGLQLHGAETPVAIFISTKNNKYRIQSDHVELLFVVIEQVVHRLSQSSATVMMKSSGIPLEHIFNKLQQYNDLEKRREMEQTELSAKSAQLRAVETLLLNKMRNAKATPLTHLDILLEFSHSQMSTCIDRLVQLEQRLTKENRALSACFNLLNLLSNLDGKQSHLFHGRMFDNTRQRAIERLRWTLSSSSSSLIQARTECSMGELRSALISIIGEGGGKLTEIVEEEEEEQGRKGEEDGFEVLQSGTVLVASS